MKCTWPQMCYLHLHTLTCIETKGVYADVLGAVAAKTYNNLRFTSDGDFYYINCIFLNGNICIS